MDVRPDLLVAQVEFFLHDALHVVGIVVLLHLGQESLFVLLALILGQIVEVVRQFLGELGEPVYLAGFVQFFVVRHLQLREGRGVVQFGKGHDDDIDEEQQDDQVESVFNVFHAGQFVDFLSDGDDVSCQQYEED